jgi:poly [ADP-ribose] polymerase
MAAIIKKIQLNYFDPSENSNKVWIGTAYDNGLFEARFGRVRDAANLAVRTKQFSTQGAAIAMLEAKEHEKLRKGYKPSRVFGENSEVVVSSKAQDLSKIAAEQIGGADDSVTGELIKYLAQVNIHHITHATSIRYNAASGAFSTPLGVLTPDAVSNARDLLNQIGDFNKKYNLDSSLRAAIIRDYFQLVPKDFGVRIPAVRQLLSTTQQIEAEVSVLDALEAAITTQTPTSSADKLFECRLTKVSASTAEGRATFQKINSLYKSTLNGNHQTAKLQLKRVYEVEITNMKSSFDEAAKRLGNVRADLWHGTKASNLLSILKNGLIIPPANSGHCTGRMFGNGIYTSLQSTKALNYATDFWNNSGARNQRTFMFLTEVALGKCHKPGSRSASFPARGTNSTWVEAGKCGVMNHECIVYEASQINLKYLAEFGAA